MRSAHGRYTLSSPERWRYIYGSGLSSPAAAVMCVEWRACTIQTGTPVALYARRSCVRSDKVSVMGKRQAYRPQVFISYYARGTDLEIATSLRIALQGSNVRIPAWRAQEDIPAGAPGIRAIEKAISESDYLLALMSPRSATQSKWCRRERGRADTLGKTIIPLIVEKIPSADYPLELEGEQRISFELGVEKGLPELLARLGVSGPGNDLPSDLSIGTPNTST